jgi:hypothetical protein
MYKVFQSKDFDKYDEAARNQAKSFWSSQGYTCTDHENEYDVDLVVEKDGKRFFCDVEVNNSLTHAAIISRKSVWDSPIVEVPNKKIRFGEKFFDIPKEKAVFIQTMQ